VSYQLQNCCFNLPRWEFSEEPLNPTKLAFGMQDKNLACVSIAQTGEDSFYALGLSDSTLDSGKNSVSAAFYFYCQTNKINNGLALLDLGSGKIWMGGIVKGRLWPSSDIIFQLQDIDYHIALFFDLIDLDESVSLFSSEAIDSEVLLSNGRQSGANDISQIDLQTFIELIQPDQRSLLKPVKRKIFSFRGLLWLAILSVSAYWSTQGYFVQKETAPVASINWNRPNEKTVQQQQQKNKRALIEAIVKQELIDLAARIKLSSLASAQLTMLHQIISQQNIYLEGWDLKVARFTYAPTQLPNLEDPQILELSYQRAAMGQVQQFISFATNKQLNYQVDLLGNIAKVKLNIEQTINHPQTNTTIDLDAEIDNQQGQSLSTIDNNEIENVLQVFNNNGEDYFKILSRIQHFCHIWQSRIGCELTKPIMIKRASRINYSDLDQAYPKGNKSPLLPYKLLNTKFKGQALNGLLRVSESLLEASSLTLI